MNELKLFSLNFLSFEFLKFECEARGRMGCEACSARSAKFKFIFFPETLIPSLFFSQNPNSQLFWFESDCNPPVLHQGATAFHSKNMIAPLSSVSVTVMLTYGFLFCY